MADGFVSWSDCMDLCPRIQTEGRVPLTLSLKDAGYLSKLYGHPQSNNMFWAPFRYKSEGDFIDHYSGTPMPQDLWEKGQPNGGLRNLCTEWDGNDLAGKLFDVPDIWTRKLQCLCQFDRIPILRMRGICKASKIDIHYALKSFNRSVIFLGVTGTKINFLPTLSIPRWTLKVNLMNTTASTSAEESSFMLGKNTWNIEEDSAQCFEGKPYTTELKMSGCTEEEFTCSNGDCVKMEERCDQVLDCVDESDEVDCNIVVLKKSYRKSAPPVVTKRENKTRKVNPAKVKVSLTLLDISAIKVPENEIDIKFNAELEWNETRATYHNLKMNMTQNTLDPSEIGLWIPKLIYRNNRDNDDTRSELMKSNIMIVRKGNFTRSGLDVMDEIEIFKGEENPIIMIQSYTRQFKCVYNLQVFPFDTQVRIIRNALLSWVCS